MFAGRPRSYFWGLRAVRVLGRAARRGVRDRGGGRQQAAPHVLFLGVGRGPRCLQVPLRATRVSRHTGPASTAACACQFPRGKQGTPELHEPQFVGTRQEYAIWAKDQPGGVWLPAVQDKAASPVVQRRRGSLVQVTTCAEWMNSVLRPRNITVHTTSFAEEMKPGVVLVNLLEELSAVKIQPVQRHPSNQAEMTGNLETVLKFLQLNGCVVSNCIAEDLYYGDASIWTRFVGLVMRHYHTSTFYENTLRRRLLIRNTSKRLLLPPPRQPPKPSRLQLELEQSQSQSQPPPEVPSPPELPPPEVPPPPLGPPPEEPQLPPPELRSFSPPPQPAGSPPGGRVWGYTKAKSPPLPNARQRQSQGSTVRAVTPPTTPPMTLSISLPIPMLGAARVSPPSSPPSLSPLNTSPPVPLLESPPPEHLLASSPPSVTSSPPLLSSSPPLTMPSPPVLASSPPLVASSPPLASSPPSLASGQGRKKGGATSWVSFASHLRNFHKMDSLRHRLASKSQQKVKQPEAPSFLHVVVAGAAAEELELQYQPDLTVKQYVNLTCEKKKLNPRLYCFKFLQENVIVPMDVTLGDLGMLSLRLCPKAIGDVHAADLNALCDEVEAIVDVSGSEAGSSMPSGMLRRGSHSSTASEDASGAKVVNYSFDLLVADGTPSSLTTEQHPAAGDGAETVEQQVAELESFFETFTANTVE
eukprot:TRINITY_DN2834_c0_g1_i6.p1 TRINITY_DN2834_c0_g1~~TRINITY_DN2834_c0_g1_i6.p1  ORF type:complete len:698 (+),score=157.18 TRINITY_DN2834_c0_g1_i6:159-2252(+)